MTDTSSIEVPETDEPEIAAGMLALHGNRTEDLAQTIAAWLQQRPLQPLEQEVVLVQSNGMAEWLKMTFAQTMGISAAVRIELPGRFVWNMYRQILGADQVPRNTPLDKASMVWNLMELLPQLLQTPEPLKAGEEGDVWQPLRQMLQESAATSPAWGQDNRQEPLLLTQRYYLALRLADLLDQYQVYRPDWLALWQVNQDVIGNTTNIMSGTAAQLTASNTIAADQLWQPALWRALLARLPEFERHAIRPDLHQRALDVLRSQGLPAHVRLPRRIVLFGMAHLPTPVLELLAALAPWSQVILAVPNPCRFYWSDALDGRELFHRETQRMRSQRHVDKNGIALAQLDMAQMHAHANPLLMTWGRQVRDYVRHLEDFDEAERAQQRMGLPRIDFYEEDTPSDASLLEQVQNCIRDLVPLCEHAQDKRPYVADDDASILFRIAHSPMREVEVLQDHLLDLFQASAQEGHALEPRDVVVMVPDIAPYAALIQAVFGQYDPQDARHIPFEVADLSAQANSPLLKAVDWLVRLPEQRASLSELSDLLATPAVAKRFGLDTQGIAQLQAWMQGSGIRWGINEAHREHLGLRHVGVQNTSWFGLERMLLGYASGDLSFEDIEPYSEVGGLAAAYVGALAHALQGLQAWSQTLQESATPAQWAERFRDLLSHFFVSVDEEDRAALALLDEALQSWLTLVDEAHFAQEIPLAVARHAWLTSLQSPVPTQRFHAGGVTFCTLMPMRAIPFKVVCLLGMNDGDYPRASLRDDLDLMAQPGQLRAGDRSRAQDDRQLMLEALLSARQQFYISWVGKNVRDNTPRPPSVLVAQLQDYLEAGWGSDVVATRTQAQPLQPFNPAYFAAGSSLHSWAHEWLPVHQAAPEANAPNAQEARSALNTQQRQATPQEDEQPWTIAQLGRFWRNPMQTWFEQRLHVRFEALPEIADDDEPLAVDAIERWTFWDELLQTLQPHIERGANMEQLRPLYAQFMQQLVRSGALPLHAAAQQLQTQWFDELSFLLSQWIEAVQMWPTSIQAQRVQLAHSAQAQWRIEDWLQNVRGQEAGQDFGNGLVLQVRPSKWLAKAAKGKQAPLVRLQPLIPVWIFSVVMACAQSKTHTGLGMQAIHQCLVGLDARLDIAPMDKDKALAQLDAILALAEKGRMTAFALAPQTGFAWLRALADGEAKELGGDELMAYADKLAQAAYDGSYQRAGEAAQNPYLARLYPDFASLRACPDYEELIAEMLAPIMSWQAQYVTVQTAPTNED